MEPRHTDAFVSTPAEGLTRRSALRRAAAASVVATWASDPSVLPWTDPDLELTRMHRPGPVQTARAPLPGHMPFVEEDVEFSRPVAHDPVMDVVKRNAAAAPAP